MTEAVTLWLLLKVFASGCTALTGVEAVSNGVKAFREPAVKNAQRTLTVIIFLLAVLLAGISYLVKVYGIAATDPGKPGYQSLLSMLIATVFGKGVFYYLTIASILFVLSLSANTAFADFPRLCRSISQNNYLPHAFGYRGRRLVYTYGIIILALLTCLLLLLFDGVTDKLIPLYAVGAFLAFTLSQFGMVVHWRKNRGAHWMKSALVNGLGGFVTGVTVIVVLVAKFAEGAWITFIFIPLLIFFFRLVRPRERQRAAHRRRSCRALEPNLQASARICLAAFPGNHRRPRRARRSFGISPHGLGTLRGTCFPRRRRRAAQAHHFAVSVSLHHRSHCSIRSRSFREASGSAHCRGHSGTGRRSLVRIFSPQPARQAPRMDAPRPRQPAHFHRQLALLRREPGRELKSGIYDDLPLERRQRSASKNSCQKGNPANMRTRFS